MNYLEEQTDGEAMINSIKNGDQPLPRVTQVSIAGTSLTKQPPLKDKSMWSDEEKKIQRLIVLQDIFDSRKADVLYGYEMFKATKGEMLLDTYIPRVETSDDKKEEKKVEEKKRDMSKVKCYNCKKEDEQVLLAEDHAWMESSSDSNQEINANMVFMAQIEKVLSDSEASSSYVDDKIVEKAKVKDYEYYKTKLLLAKKDKDERVLLAEDHAWMENSSEDQEINANMQTSSLKPYVQTVILEKIIIDLEDEVVSLLAKEKENLEIIKSLKSKCFESSEKEISESENHSKNDCQVVENVCDDLENSNVIAPGMFKLKNLKKIESLKSNGFESSEIAISESENQSENDCLAVEKECDKMKNSKVIAFGMFKLNVSQSVLPMSMSKTSCEYNNVESNRALLTNFVEKFLRTVRFRNNDFAVIVGYEDVVIGSMTIKRVYYVEGLGEVFHEVFESFQGDSSSSLLNDDVQSLEEVILPQTNTQSISNDMIPNVDEAISSHNPYPHEQKWTKDHPLHKIICDPKSSVRTRGQLTHSCLFACLLSSIEPANMAEALKDIDRVIAMQDKLDQFSKWKV
nr:hypothetical protein [Tanacetum cinerariifolium]